jgi:TonB family protein
MRLTSRAVLVFALVAATPAAQLDAQQDALINSARQAARQGDHDSAISTLRFALASRPNDESLKNELLNVLMMKRTALSQQLSELSREIAALRGPVVSGISVSPSGSPRLAPVRVGGEIRQPMRIVDVKPIYPAVAREARLQGIIILEATIDEQGNVADAKVLRGQPLLNDAALEAVRQWKYTTTLLNGVPVPVIMTVTVTFTLPD